MAKAPAKNTPAAPVEQEDSVGVESITKVSAKLGKDKNTDAQVTVDFVPGDNLDDLIEKFGEKIVFVHARASIVIGLQSFLRGQLSTDPRPSAKEIQAKVNEWKPGTRIRVSNPVEKIKKLTAGLSEEQKKELRKLLNS